MPNGLTVQEGRAVAENRNRLERAAFPEEESAALAHWRAQEEAPLPSADPNGREDPVPSAGDDLPSPIAGWWLLPAIALGLAIWVRIGLALLQ